MIVLLTGTAVYNGSVTVPGFEPPAPFQSLVKHPSLALGDKILGSPMIQVGVAIARKGSFFCERT